MSEASRTPDVRTIERIISVIDLTDLDDEHRPDGIGSLLNDASRHQTAAVCVWPEFVRRSVEELAGSGVRVATVVNFPSGESSVAEVAAEVQASLADGADEIDVVLPWRRFLEGDAAHARSVIEVAKRLVADVAGAHLKVILETGELRLASQIADATRMAIDSGADFVKTSTGKTATGATPEAVDTMLGVMVERHGDVGIKPSGGVRTVADAITYLDLVAEHFGDEWATPKTFRFGASGLLTDALETLEALGRA